MQTFVPHTDYKECARVLDNKRLNKQLLEGRQIIGILTQGKTKGAWVNHPAVKMWRGSERELFNYLRAIRDECSKRGIATEKNWNAILDFVENATVYGERSPEWWTDIRVFHSHRQNLFDKDPEYYGQYAYSGPKVTCCDRCNYFWPTHLLIYNEELVA